MYLHILYSIEVSFLKDDLKAKRKEKIIHIEYLENI